MLLENHALRAKLHPLGIVGAARHVRTFPAFVVNGADAIAFALDQIHSRDETEAARRQRDGAGVNAFVVLCGRRQVSAGFVHTPMRVSSLDRVHGIGPFALHPFEIRKTRAVLEFVDHASRQERQVPRQSGAGERQFPLRIVHGGSTACAARR